MTQRAPEWAVGWGPIAVELGRFLGESVSKATARRCLRMKPPIPVRYFRGRVRVRVDELGDWVRVHLVARE